MPPPQYICPFQPQQKKKMRFEKKSISDWKKITIFVAKF
jgi:hypothetical protein